MPRAGPRKVQRHGLEFKLKAVKLSQLKGVEVQAVADVLPVGIGPPTLEKPTPFYRGLLRSARLLLT